MASEQPSLRAAQAVHALHASADRTGVMLSSEVVAYDAAAASTTSTGQALSAALKLGLVDRFGHDARGRSLWVITQPGRDLLDAIEHCAYDDVERKLEQLRQATKGAS